MSETDRLEGLWAGEFGNEYTERNADAWKGRGAFWLRLLGDTQATSVLEVGCGSGHNMRWIDKCHVPVTGVDINAKAAAIAAQFGPVLVSTVRALPFSDGEFDLVFTAGVHIHLPTESLIGVMAEIVRCARRYVLCMEYEHPWLLEIPYRGQQGALFKRDYGRLYQNLFPGLHLKKRGCLGKDAGFDDVTYWLFEKML